MKAGDPLVQLDAARLRADGRARRGESRARAGRGRPEGSSSSPRIQALQRTGVVSRDELDIRRAEADTAAGAASGTAKADLEAARVALEYTTLRAPRSGVILAKLKEVGEIAVPGGFSGSGDLIRMANLDDLRGQVDITESELAKVPHRAARRGGARRVPRPPLRRRTS